MMVLLLVCPATRKPDTLPDYFSHAALRLRNAGCIGSQDSARGTLCVGRFALASMAARR